MNNNSVGKQVEIDAVVRVTNTLEGLLTVTMQKLRDINTDQSRIDELVDNFSTGAVAVYNKMVEETAETMLQEITSAAVQGRVAQVQAAREAMNQLLMETMSRDGKWLRDLVRQATEMHQQEIDEMEKLPSQDLDAMQTNYLRVLKEDRASRLKQVEAICIEANAHSVAAFQKKILALASQQPL